MSERPLVKTNEQGIFKRGNRYVVRDRPAASREGVRPHPGRGPAT